MTVAELIAKLQDQPPDAIVVVNMSKNELANGRPVGTVELVIAKRWTYEADIPPDEWIHDYCPEEPLEGHEDRATIVNLTPWA